MSPATIDPCTLTALRAEAFYGSDSLGIATAFIYRQGDRVFVVTNGHVVHGRHANTGEVLHPHGSVPDRLVAILHGTERLGSWKRCEIELYDKQGRPDWFEHPLHGATVDIAALELSGDTETVKFFPANESAMDDFSLEVSQDVFILGFPRGVTGHSFFPVWKRGTVASEPNVDLGGLPRFLVDSSTREGMSGAPVFAQLVGFHQARSEGPSLEDWIGRGRRFAGIYSARVSGDAFEAQLGYVWKASAIIDIVVGRKRPR